MEKKDCKGKYPLRQERSSQKGTFCTVDGVHYYYLEEGRVSCPYLVLDDRVPGIGDRR